ncbi:MAG: hypothetical protein KatS3mg121_0409 [Gammaproteobacteria bacterium]|nr:MAG: hypothetical protein KatS3mg121_0409 [Gammaproteobacteria bacterium]
MPDHPVALALLEALGEPLMSVSLIPPGQEQPLADPDEVAAAMAGRIDLVLDGGPCRPQPTTVLDLTGPVPEVLRRGAGPVDWLD